MPTPEEQRIVQEQQKKKVEFDKAVREMEKHVRKNPDGTFTLDANSAREANVDPAAFDALKKSLDHTNDHVKSGRLKGKDVRDKQD